jgi:hypothetical protein
MNVTLLQAQTARAWEFIIEPYLMLPAMYGTSGVGELPEIEVDASTSDIFSSLKFGAMLYAEANNGKWVFSTDLLYMNLEQDAEPDILVDKASLQAKQLGWENAGLRSINKWFDAGIGLRLNSISLFQETTFVNENLQPRSRELTQTWVDPILILRLHSEPMEDFIYQVRGDIGGFGIGSDFAWQLQVYFGYQFSQVFHMTMGYRIISMDYESGSGDDRFLYDINTAGLNVRFGFTIR